MEADQWEPYIEIQTQRLKTASQNVVWKSQTTLSSCPFAAWFLQKQKQTEKKKLNFQKKSSTLTLALSLSHTQEQRRRPCSVLPVWVDLQHRFIKLRDLSVDEGLQRLLQPVVIPLQLPLVLLLVWTNQALILTQGIFTPLAEQSVKHWHEDSVLRFLDGATVRCQKCLLDLLKA